MTELLEKEAAAVDAGLRPYLPDRATLRILVDGLVDGSKVLVARGWERVWGQAGDWREALTRLGYAAGGVYVAVYALRTPGAAPVVPFVGPALAGTWCVAAWIVAPAAGKPARAVAGKPEPGDVDDGQEHEELEGAGEGYSPEVGDVVVLVHQVAARHGHQGAHLDDLIATGQLADWDKTELRSALDAWGVPVAEFKLRFEGRQRVRMGVRLRDLPALPGEAPAGGAPAAPASTPAEGAVATPAGAPAEGPVEGAVEASPALPAAPSQGPR
jgi:hypothetical protein